MGRPGNVFKKENDRREFEIYKGPSGFSAKNSLKREAQMDESNQMVVRAALMRNDDGLA